MELHFFDINFKMNILGLILGFIVVISDNTGVLAQRRSRWQDGSIRLVGGQNDNEGTVLIYHWSRWGAVCDDYWDIRDANVVCNELGFPGASDAPRESKYGKGRRRVWLSGLHCRGHERHLTMCKSRGWGIFHRRCRKYFTSAGVVCNPKTTAITRLSTTTSTTTRKRTTPTTTSSTTTTAMTTTPTTSKTTTNHAKTTTTSNRRPTTTETTTKAPLKTTTTPKRTTTTRSTAATPPRAYNRWIYNRELWRYFMYFRDGTHVTSRPDPRYYRLHGRRATSTTTSTSTSTTTTTTTTTKPPVIVDSLYNEIGGNNEHASVDEYIRGNNNDIQNNINYLVPQSGDNQDQSFRHSPHHHHHNNVKDGYLGDAPYAVDTDEVITIKPVKEEPEPTAPSYTEFRLSGGRVYTGFNEGRLEVRLAGRNKWGVVCGDNWDFQAAMVACRHIGVGYARTAQTTDLYGGSNKDKVLANIKCTGKEDRLEDCSLEKRQSTPGHEACSSARSVAGVICDTRLPDLMPNITRLEYSAYLQDRYLYYLQCAFEEGCLSSSAEALYGTNSWTTKTRRLLRFSTIAHNVGTADFRPDVDRSKWEWHACHQHYHSMESFSHYDIIDRHGNKVAEGHKASFCLEDSECIRGTFPKYNCQNWGQQGISVGCADSYLADIDCQWIDVTDVRSGMYTLKIELNPNMLVPEISYENNVAVCDLYFNTASVRLYNCRHEGLL